MINVFSLATEGKIFYFLLFASQMEYFKMSMKNFPSGLDQPQTQVKEEVYVPVPPLGSSG